MTLPSATSFSPLQIRSAATPPQAEKVITPGRELTREERKVARRRNGAMDVLPTYVGKRLTFTLPSAFAPKLGPSTSNTLNRILSNSPHRITSPVQSHKLSPIELPPKIHPSASQTFKSPPTNPEPTYGPDLNQNDRQAKTRAKPSHPKPSKKNDHRQNRSGKGKEKALPLSHGRSILSKLKSFSEGASRATGSVLRLESPSKLAVLGQSNKPNTSQSPQSKPLTRSLSNRPQSSSGQEPSHEASSLSDHMQVDNVSSTVTKPTKKSRSNAPSSTKSGKEPISSITHPSLKKRKVSPLHELSSTTTTLHDSSTSRNENAEHVQSKSPPVPSNPLRKSHRSSPSPVNDPQSLNLKKSGVQKRKGRKPNNVLSSSEHVESFPGFNSNIPHGSLTVAPHPAEKNRKPPSSSCLDTESIISSIEKAGICSLSSSLSNHKLDEMKENGAHLTIPILGMPSHPLRFQPFEIEDPSDFTTAISTGESSSKNTMSGAAFTGSSEPHVSDSASQPRGISQIVQRKEPRELSCDSHVTPTVVSTPRVSRHGSPNESLRMKTLAARIFTPGALVDERTQKDSHEPEDREDIMSQSVGPSDRINRAERQIGLTTTQEVNDERQGAEQQIYIVADRLIREEVDEDRWFEEVEGKGLSLETQALILKIKSQLNPADIILISIRKLIEDEIEKLFDINHHHQVEHEAEGDRIKKSIDLERDCLQSTLENFKFHMLDYSDQLVRFGLLKLQLNQLNSRIKKNRFP